MVSYLFLPQTDGQHYNQLLPFTPEVAPVSGRTNDPFVQFCINVCQVSWASLTMLAIKKQK